MLFWVLLLCLQTISADLECEISGSTEILVVGTIRKLTFDCNDDVSYFELKKIGGSGSVTIYPEGETIQIDPAYIPSGSYELVPHHPGQNGTAFQGSSIVFLECLNPAYELTISSTFALNAGVALQYNIVFYDSQEYKNWIFSHKITKKTSDTSIIMESEYIPSASHSQATIDYNFIKSDYLSGSVTFHGELTMTYTGNEEAFKRFREGYTLTSESKVGTLSLEFCEDFTYENCPEKCQKYNGKCLSCAQHKNVKDCTSMNTNNALCHWSFVEKSCYTTSSGHLMDCKDILTEEQCNSSVGCFIHPDTKECVSGDSVTERLLTFDYNACYVNGTIINTKESKCKYCKTLDGFIAESTQCMECSKSIFIDLISFVFAVLFFIISVIVLTSSSSFSQLPTIRHANVIQYVLGMTENAPLA